MYRDRAYVSSREARIGAASGDPAGPGCAESRNRRLEAENAPEARRVAPNPWATLSVHVVATPASHAALEVGGLSVHSFLPVSKYLLTYYLLSYP